MKHMIINSVLALGLTAGSLGIFALMANAEAKTAQQVTVIVLGLHAGGL